jgi:carbon-monoxide dehydrogenase medium subunit
MTEPRVAVGAVEPYARRLREAEEVLRGRTPSANVFAAAAKVAAAAVDPMEDINNTSAYRRGLVLTLTQRALESAE